MGQILEFPSQQAQGLAFLDRELRQLLHERGADAELIDYAASQLTDIYARFSSAEHYSFEVELPAGISADERGRLQTQINAGLEGIREENHALMVKLVAQLVLAQVRLFQHERSE